MRFPVVVSIFIGLSCLHFKLFAQEVIRDYDGNKYKTVMIGEQLWMAENLKSIHDARGEKIKRVCYHLIQENCEIYGGLYAWNDLKIDEKNGSLQGICPDSWHIPTDEDWAMLIEKMGGADSAAYRLSRETPEFNIQYGGNYHSRLRNYNYLEANSYYWTANSYSTTAAFIWMIGKNNLNANRSSVPKVYGMSVRCIKD